LLNGGIDVSQMIATMDELKTMSGEDDPATRTRDIATTNIIGQGVDVDRFNVIVSGRFLWRARETCLVGCRRLKSVVMRSSVFCRT
jgi:hypothetical protein